MKGWVLAFAALASAARTEPARFKTGSLPAPPAAAVGGGEVLLEVEVDTSGRVAAVRVLRDTPPYTEALRGAVRDWTFAPAAAGEEAVPSAVLVGGSFRPPTLAAPAVGEAPKDVAAPSARVLFPAQTAPALYPPRAQGDGQVLVEIRIAGDGGRATRVVRGAQGFDDAALQAAGQWSFRPGTGVAYVLFGFRQPVTAAPPAR
jgi:outer membrane biosynthesis protein TonB